MGTILSTHRPRARHLFVGMCAWLTFVSLPSAADITLTSTAQRTALLELYTSEGCSSCPAADRWLRSLRNDTRLWRDVVPVAFHVDYWNHLGWRDRFSRAQYTARQQRYAASGLVRTVYTPGFVLNGREWRAWFDDPTLPPNAGATVGVLHANIANSGIIADYVPAVARHDALQLTVAWLGFGLVTRVESGENRDRTLNHDFVVLDLQTTTGLADSAGSRYEWKMTTKPPSPEVGGVAIWISRADEPSPIQAVGGMLDSGQAHSSSPSP